MNPIVQEVLAAVEIAVEKAVAEKAEVIVEKVIEALAKAIPGQLDDMLLQTVKPQAQALVKAELLKLADKIDGQEG